MRLLWGVGTESNDITTTSVPEHQVDLFTPKPLVEFCVLNLKKTIKLFVSCLEEL